MDEILGISKKNEGDLLYLDEMHFNNDKQVQSIFEKRNLVERKKDLKNKHYKAMTRKLMQNNVIGLNNIEESSNIKSNEEKSKFDEDNSAFFEETYADKKNNIVIAMKDYEFKISKNNEIQLSSLEHEKKHKKLLALKDSIIKKNIKKKLECKNIEKIKISIQKKQEDLKNNANKKKNFVSRLKNQMSVFKKLGNKQKYKLESRFKKIRDIYLRKKKIKKQMSKKHKKTINFLNYTEFGHTNYNKLISFIELNDWRAFIEKKASGIFDSK